MPSLRRNKVWLAIKTESIQVAKEVFGERDGIIIYNNFIIQARQPTMNLSTIWGQITQLIGDEDTPTIHPAEDEEPETPIEPEEP
jgi:hypothetical protein